VRFKQSFADNVFRWIFLMICVATISEVYPEWELGIKGGSIHKERPYHSWNPEKPVDLFTVFITLKQIRGKDLTQPVWFLLM
jgi:hypothetical protein